LNLFQQSYRIKTWALPQITLVLKNLSVSTLMLGLLLAFTQLVKFMVLLIQDIVNLSEQYGFEQETISRTSKYYVYNTFKNARTINYSNELTTAAEQINEQLTNQRILFTVLIMLSAFGFVLLYFALDYLIDFTRRYRPWSILVLLLTFVISVFYIEITDLKRSGNGYAFMFTTLISIITGIVLIGYSLIFPNYSKVEN